MNRFDYALWGAKAINRRGEDLPHSRLNAEKVRAIRLNKKGMTAKQQSIEYGVHYRTIEKVLANETWNHIK